MSGNDFFTFGIGNGKWPSVFPIFGIWNRNKKYNSQLSGLGMGMGMNNQIPNLWDWEWE
jgi:hypothetical protein